jgi:hypothetical protein
MRIKSLVFGLIVLSALSGPGLLCAQDSKVEAFFETRIRPLLVEHCYECHSQEAAAQNHLKGGLLLDSAAAIRQGGDSGSAINLDELDSSLLLTAVRYQDLEMPPDGKLSEREIADLRQWISDGLYHPGSSNSGSPKPPTTKNLDIEAAKKAWPYRPLVDVPIPGYSNNAWPHQAIDAFLLQKSAPLSLSPSAAADQNQLARRLYFDLTGLPPTPEQLDAFLNDSAPDAYDRLVDQLLASPAFGVRWGRHWLDIVRYAESTTLRGLIYADAWRYRDYIIQALQEDRPLDALIREQVAGDLLPYENLEEHERNLIATTFLALGNHNLEEQDKQQLRMDVVDEQLDVIGQALLGQTIGCARCHDHKFDPIPTHDYYALAGILRNVQTLQDANVSNWVTRPLPLAAEQQEAFNRMAINLDQLQQQLKTAKADLGKLTAVVSESSIALDLLPGIVVDDSQAQLVGDWTKSQHVRPFVGEGYVHDDNSLKGEKTITFATNKLQTGSYEVRLAYSPAESRAENISITVASADGEKQVRINQRLKPEISPCFVSLGNHRFETGGQAYVLISTADSQGYVTADAVQFLPLDQDDSLVTTSTVARLEEKETVADRRALEQQIATLEKQKKELESKLKERPQVMSIVERPQIEESFVHIRGIVHSRGAEVARGFLQVAGGDLGLNMPKSQSGRLELAQWLVEPRNPLTSRVLANRIWTWTMGMGLARNPDHIGPSSEAPLHPELIDYLAMELQRNEWSLKSLVRKVVTSAAYRQSVLSVNTLDQDPDNRFWMRSHKKFLSAEAIRDSMLHIAGMLDQQMYGSDLNPLPAADYGYEHRSQRRSVFLPMLRNSLPKLLVAFDMADSSRVTGSRNQSIVAPQALLMLNSDEVGQYAQAAASRLLQHPLASDSARLDFVFRQTLSRSPTATEQELFLDYLSNVDKAVDSWRDVYQTLFGSAEFRSLD